MQEFLTGSRSEQDVDRVLATVMFTDIVDSTKRAAELGDRQWRALLDRHDETVRQQLARFRGNEVKNLGDGFLATFDGPARAVRCAAAISESIRPLGITVRSGLHTGEIELKRDDIAGIEDDNVSWNNLFHRNLFDASITKHGGSDSHDGKQLFHGVACTALLPKPKEAADEHN